MKRISRAKKLTAALVATSVAFAGAVATAGGASAQDPDGNGSINTVPFPVGIAVNDLGERFVAQTSTDTVAVYSAEDDTGPVRTLGGMDDYAWAIAFDSNNATYVTCPSAGVIYVFDEGATEPTRVIRDHDSDPEDEGDLDQTTDPFSGVLGIAIDSSDTVFVANTTNGDDSVYVIDAGQSTPNTSKRITGLTNPTALAVDPDDNLYVGSHGVELNENPANTVQVVPAGTTSVDSSKTISGLRDVYGIAFGLNNRLYVGNTSTIRVYDATTHAILPSKELTGLTQTFGIASVPDGLLEPVGGTIYATQYTNATIKRFSPGPLVEANPAAVTLADTLVGDVTTQSVTVTNSGSSNLQLTASPVSMTGASGQYSITNNTCANSTLTPGGEDTCSFTVRFAPTSRGEKSMTVSIASNSPDTPYTLPATGRAIAPVATSSPTTWDFESVLVDGTPESKVFTISNDGDAPLVFPASAVDLTGPNAGQFSLASETCSATSVAPTQTCTATVEFDPTSTGAKSANLRISPSAPETAHSYALTGVGTQPGFSPSVSTVAFGEVVNGTTSAASTVVVTNDGTAPLNFPASAVAVGGADADNFTITSDTCSTQTVAVSATCTVAVTFSPTGTATYAASLAFTNDAPLSPQTVLLGGSGVPPSPETTPSPASKSFNTHNVGVTAPASQQFTITNTGTSVLNVEENGVSLTGSDVSDFNITADSCSAASVAVSNSCSITVRFDPQTSGDKAAVLRIASNEPDAPRQVPLSGSAITTASAPSSVVASAGNRYVNVSWGPVTSTGNSDVTGYRVKVATAPGGPYVDAVGCSPNLASTARSCRATNVTNGRSHYLQVSAINAAGTGAPQTSAAVLPRAVAQSPVRCPIPRRARKVGRTLIIPTACRTNAGQLIRVSGRGVRGAKVVRSGVRWFVIMSKRKGVATFVLSAPATGVYLPMTRRLTFRN